MDNLSDDVLGLGGGPDIPSVQAENRKQTATVVDRGSEEARRQRNRRRGAVSGDRLGPPKLGTPGLLGTGPTL